ncbi:MAG: hypothetical protein ASARMPRED_003218 [Alectoria sarmentosa]|nr:MAG: hypothetical protein ASARMPRED_003218 [Alectoria sarmentosa]
MSSQYLGLATHVPRFEPPLTTYIALSIACILPALLWGLTNVLALHSRQDKPEGCRKLGLNGKSHLVDEHDDRYKGAVEGQQNGAATWRVKSLWIYPIKSCRGVELERGTVIGTGMEYDRQFSFAQLSGKFPVSASTPLEEKAKHTWKFTTQRSLPPMATIKTEVWVPDPSSPTYSGWHPNVQSGGVLVIKFPRIQSDEGFIGKVKDILALVFGQPEREIHIPFNPTPEQIAQNGYAVDDMEIWKDRPRSLIVASTEKDDLWIQELRSYLGITNHFALFRVSKDDQPREVYRCAPRKEELGYQPTIGFQDAYPLHILNLASVRDVESKLQEGAPPLSARNFRPNIVITGGGAYDEDSWKRIKIGGYHYYVSCRTVRCLLPNVNPITGHRHRSEPNRTLKDFRCIDAGDAKNACLGMQMVPALEDSQIQVGDEIKVLETGEHLYIKQ